MDLIEYLTLGGTIKLPYKNKLKEWYGEISLSFIDNKPFFTGFNYDKYKISLNKDDSIYLLLSIYKHWDNLAYIFKRLQNKNIFPYDLEEIIDFDNPSTKIKKTIKEEKELVKKEWLQEFSEEKLKTFEKIKIKDPIENIQNLIKGKEVKEYYDLLSDYIQEIENLGSKCRITLFFINPQYMMSVETGSDAIWSKNSILSFKEKNKENIVDYIKITIEDKSYII